MSRRRSPSSKIPAWWTEPGPSVCDFCLATFHLEVGYYCADCDRPICPGCITRIREQSAIICPECGGAGHGSEVPD